MGCSIERIIQMSEPLRYGSIKVVTNDIDITELCRYSWSSDMVCWTDFVDIHTYNRIASNIESDFYIKIWINRDFDYIIYNGHKTNCYNVSLYNKNIFLESFCDNENLFQPYNNLDCALLLQQQLADSIVCMFGIPIIYIKIDPDKTSSDFTFKEYVFNNVTSVKQLKLMIPDGTMPSSKPLFSEYDFDWESDWETELGKTQFATAFGDNAYPKTGDCIYIPMMKRMWEVNAAYDEKNEGLMWRSTTWKLQLKKYNESTNVDRGDFESIFDNVSFLYDNTFFKIENEEQRTETGIEQGESPQFAATNTITTFMSDSIRYSVSKDIIVNTKQLNNKSTIICRNFYTFPTNDSRIIYQQKACGDNYTISFIFSKAKVDTEKYTILSIGKDIIVYSQNNKIIFEDLEMEFEYNTVYLCVLRLNRKNFTIELELTKHTHRPEIPEWKLKPEMFYFDFNNSEKLTSNYQNKFIYNSPQLITLSAAFFNIYNFKVYDSIIIESNNTIQYTTNNENCIINDNSRPLLANHGYDVR